MEPQMTTYIKELTAAIAHGGEAAVTEGDGYCVATFAEAERDPGNAYKAFLLRNGFAQEAEKAVTGNQFSIYANACVRVHTSWYPSKRLFKAVFEQKGYAPMQEKPHTDAVCTPQIVQLGRRGASERLPNGAPGMSYVLQTASGGFIIIDGGPMDQNREDEKQLLEFLLQNKPAKDEKPRILAWFITHAHHDHIHLAVDFLKDHADKIVLDTVAYNFPLFSRISITHEDASKMGDWAEAFKEQVAHDSHTNTLLLHTGQRFWLEDATVDVVYTADDFAPEIFPWGNHTCCAFRVTFGGKTFLVLGDCEKKLCQFMADVYGAALKSDILQVSHHGVNGACIDLYQAVDPDICFWPIDEFRFFNHVQIRGEKAWDFNRWILDDSIKKRAHYHSSADTVLKICNGDIVTETL